MIKPYYEEPGITIYHGDCREILPQLPKVDLMLTDPPYNIGLGEKAHSKRQNGYGLHDDNLSGADYLNLIGSVINFMSMSDLTVITPGNSNQKLWPTPKWTMAWIKTNGVTRTPLTRGQKINHACWEPILVYGVFDDPPHSDVISLPIGLQQEAEGHPCPKPLKLFMKIISYTKSQTILDPFMGSGTTLRAAKDLGRKAIGIEIEEKYCEIAVKRLRQEVLNLTGDHS